MGKKGKMGKNVLLPKTAQKRLEIVGMVSKFHFKHFVSVTAPELYYNYIIQVFNFNIHKKYELQQKLQNV